MSDQPIDVKIVHLEPLRVACVNGFGTSPENQAYQKMSAYVKAKGFDRDGQPHRFFGFNNPNPSPGSPNYGYDVWMTVAEDVQSEGEVTVMDFQGGLYAVMSFQPVSPEEIYPSWQHLLAWVQRSPYRVASHQWLEEHIGPIDLSFPDLALDLFLPISE